MATPLKDYGANKGLADLGKESRGRLRDITQVYAAQRAGLDVSQRNAQEKLGQDINRFAAVNRLDPGSGALLKFKTDATNKAAQEFAAQKTAVGGEEAKAREALSSEIGQRRLPIEESYFNRATAVLQSQLAARAQGITNPGDWARLIGGSQQPFSQLFGGLSNLPTISQQERDFYINQTRVHRNFRPPSGQLEGN